jgi:hypothetical protein
MRAHLLIAASIVLTGCGSSEGYARPRVNSALQTGRYYPSSLEQRVAALERNVQILAARLCQVESKLDPVTFRVMGNGGVIMQRSGQPARYC